MRDLIKKILKEEQEDDGFNWADSSVNSPAQVLENLELESEWVGYIPEISKQISFTVNPESSQPMASIRISNVESRGHGRFGDYTHRKYEPGTLDNLRFGRSNWNPEGSESVGTDENRGELYNVMDVARDIKGYSEDAKQLTIEYKQRIQELTKQYAENLQSLHTQYHFDGSEYDPVTVATVDSQGEVWTDDKWDKTNGGFRDYPGHDDVWDKKNRRGGFNGGDFPPNI